MDKPVVPKNPVPAVAGIILRDKEILLIRRGREPGAGLWSIPGGCVEFGESLEEALKREVKEETGLKIEVDDFAGLVDLMIREDGEIRFHYIILDYFASVVSGDMRAASDVTDCRWVPLDQLKDYEITHSLLRRLKELGLLDSTEG